MGRSLELLALVLLVSLTAARPFLNEMPFRTSAVAATQAGGDASAAGGWGDIFGPDRAELSRVSFACAILLTCAIWLIGQALTGRLQIRMGFLGLLMAGFVAAALVSALCASNKRAALDGWLEQASMMAGAFLAIQLFTTRGRVVLLLAVLSAVGGTLAIKAFLQYFVEVPERIAQFQMYGLEQLHAAGLTSGSPQAIALQNRVNDQSATGFFGLANMLASLLMVLLGCCAGLAAEMLAAARAGLKFSRGTRRKGEVHLPTVWAVLMLVMTLAIGVALLMTRSRAGIVCAAAGAAAAFFIARYRRTLAAHWRRNVAMAVAGLVVALAGTCAYGLAHDALPSKSMTFRWYYWTASAQIIRQHPVLGVGSDNFPAAYLAVRRAAAEEAVKMPHNVIVQALSEYGLLGGGLYLAVLVAMLVFICRPSEATEIIPPRGGGSPKPPDVDGSVQVRMLLAVPVVVLISRIVFGGSANAFSVIYDSVLPTAALAGLLVFIVVVSRVLAVGSQGGLSLARIAVGCGLAAFVLHNLSEFTLFVPGAAAVFWLTAGAMVSYGSPQHVRCFKHARWPAAGLALAGVAAAALLLARPVAARTMLVEQMAAQCSRGQFESAAATAQAAWQADPLDGLTAADVAKLLMRSNPTQAHEWALRAAALDVARASYRQLAAEASWFAAHPDVLEYAWSGVHGDPAAAAATLRANLDKYPPAVGLSQLAGLEFAMGHYDKAAQLLTQAIGHDGRSAMLRQQLGDALYMQGDRGGAHAAWQAAHDLIAVAQASRTVPPEEPRSLPASPSQTYLAEMQQAVERNPMDLRLRLAYAEMADWAGDPQLCMDQLAQVRGIEGQLFSGSIECLSPAEQIKVKLLAARCEVASTQ